MKLKSYKSTLPLLIAPSTLLAKFQLILESSCLTFTCGIVRWHCSLLASASARKEVGKVLFTSSAPYGQAAIVSARYVFKSARSNHLRHQHKSSPEWMCVRSTIKKRCMRSILYEKYFCTVTRCAFSFGTRHLKKLGVLSAQTLGQLSPVPSLVQLWDILLCLIWLYKDCFHDVSSLTVIMNRAPGNVWSSLTKGEGGDQVNEIFKDKSIVELKILWNFTHFVWKLTMRNRNNLHYHRNIDTYQVSPFLYAERFRYPIFQDT